MPVEVLQFNQADPEIQDTIRKKAFKARRKPEDYQVVLDLDDSSTITNATIEEVPGEITSGIVSSAEQLPATIIGVGAGAAAGALAAPSVIGAPVAAIGAGTAASMGTSFGQRKFLEWAAPSLQRRLDIYSKSNPKSAMLGAGVSSLAPQRMLLGGIGREALARGAKGALTRTLAKEGLTGKDVVKLAGLSAGVGAGIDTGIQTYQNFQDTPEEGVIGDTLTALSKVNIPSALAQGALEAGFGSGNVRPWLGRPLNKGLSRLTGKPGLIGPADSGTSQQAATSGNTVQAIPTNNLDAHNIALDEISKMGVNPTPEQIRDFNNKWVDYAFSADPQGVALIKASKAQLDALAAAAKEKQDAEILKQQKQQEEQQRADLLRKATVVGEPVKIDDEIKVFADFLKKGGATKIPVGDGVNSVLIDANAKGLGELKERNPQAYEALKVKLQKGVDELKATEAAAETAKVQAKKDKEAEKARLEAEKAAQKMKDEEEAARLAEEKRQVDAKNLEARRLAAEGRLLKAQQRLAAIKGGEGTVSSLVPVTPGLGAYGGTMAQVPRTRAEVVTPPPVSAPTAPKETAPTVVPPQVAPPTVETPAVPTTPVKTLPLKAKKTKKTVPAVRSDEGIGIEIVDEEPAQKTTPDDIQTKPKGIPGIPVGAPVVYKARPPYDREAGKKQLEAWKKGDRKYHSRDLIEYVAEEVRAGNIEPHPEAGDLNAKQAREDAFIPQDVAKNNNIGERDLGNAPELAKQFAMAFATDGASYLKLYRDSLDTLASGMKGEALRTQTIDKNVSGTIDESVITPDQAAIQNENKSLETVLDEWRIANNITPEGFNKVLDEVISFGGKNKTIQTPEGFKKFLEAKTAELSKIITPIPEATPEVVSQTGPVEPKDLIKDEWVKVTIPKSKGQKEKTFAVQVTTPEGDGLKAKGKVDGKGDAIIIPSKAKIVRLKNNGGASSLPQGLMSDPFGLGIMGTAARVLKRDIPRLISSIKEALARGDWKTIDSDYSKVVADGDLDAAQAMVDEVAKSRGYNIGPVWHGIKGEQKDFTSFDPEKSRFSKGFFFSPDYDTAKKWANFFGGEDYEPGKFYLKLENPLKDSGRAREGRDATGLSEIKTAQEAGNDGVILAPIGEKIKGKLKYAPQYIVFSPEGIKSADPITKDNQGNVIPLSERFNPKETSTLYTDPFGLATIYQGLSNIPTLSQNLTKRLATGLSLLLDRDISRGGLQNLLKVNPRNAPTVIAGYRDYSQRLQAYNNSWNEPFLAVEKKYKFTPAEHKRVTKHIDYLSTQNGVSPVNLTQRETALYNALNASKMRSFLDKRDGPYIDNTREARQDKNWWWDAEMDSGVRKELQTEEGEKKYRRIYENWYLQEKGSLSGVDEAWNAITGKTVTKMESEGPTYASMRKAQGIGLPVEMRVKDAALRMFIHNIRAAADLGFHWAFERDPARARIMGISDDGRGVKYDITSKSSDLLAADPVGAAKYFPPEDGANSPVDNLAHLDDIKNLRAHLNSARGMNLDMADRITGLVNGLIMGPFTVVRDAATTVGASWEILGIKDMPMLIRGAAKAFMGGAADMKRGGGIRSRRTGDFIGQEAEIRDLLTKIGDFGRTWQGRDAGEKAIRNTLWETAKLYEKGLIQRALGDEAGAIAQMEYFVGNDWKKILSTPEGKQRLSDRFAKGFTEHFQGNYGPEYLPWGLVRGTDKQFLRLVFNLSRWGIERANRFREFTIDGVKKTGNIKPLLKYTLGAGVASVAYDYLMEHLMDKKPREMTMEEYIKFAFNSSFSTKDKIDEFIYTALSKASLMGFAGLYGQLAENIYKLKEGETGMLPNIPAITMAKKVGERFQQYVTAKGDPTNEDFWYGLLELGRVLATDNIQGARGVEGMLKEEDISAGREGRMFKRLEAKPFENAGDIFNIRSANPFTASGKFIRETDETAASSLLPDVLRETERRGLDSPPRAKFPMISKSEKDPAKVVRYYDFMRSVGKGDQLDTDLALWDLNRKKNATSSLMYRQMQGQ